MAEHGTGSLATRLDPDAVLRLGARLHGEDEECEAELLHSVWLVSVGRFGLGERGTHLYDVG